MQGNVSQMASCAVVNINLCLAERGVAMAIVTVRSPGNIKTTFRLFFFFFFFWSYIYYGKAWNFRTDTGDVMKIKRQQ